MAAVAVSEAAEVVLDMDLGVAHAVAAVAAAVEAVAVVVVRTTHTQPLTRVLRCLRRSYLRFHLLPVVRLARAKTSTTVEAASAASTGVFSQNPHVNSY